MKELTSEELKEVQLNMMDYVDWFCRDNCIEYTLASGTLLGAIRHGGFIPWDDDIDIHLLRKEYNKFIFLWNEHKEKHPFELISIESGNNMGYPFAKIHDPKTITYIGAIERTGVFIDVFPVDFVRDQSDLIERYTTIAKLYEQRTQCFNWMLIKSDRRNISLKRLLYTFLKKPKASYNDLAKKISDLAQAMNESTDYVFEMACGFIGKNAVPTKVYEEYCDVKFENRLYRRVKDYDTLLTKAYGDWRKLPPVEERVTHHAFKAYWKD